MPSSGGKYPLLREAGLFVAHARVSGPKGSRLVRLAVDTGATSSMIPPKIAVAIGVHPARAKTIRETVTVSGKEFIPLVLVPRLRVFESTLRRIPVICHALPLESPVEGLLGLDLLTRLGAVIDLRTSSIRLRSARHS